jgi:RNA polymerase sigma factor (TIGR02999 family)
MDESPSLTKQLRHFSGGDRLIAEAVLREVLPELHKVAVRELRREHNATPLSPTELIHEVWLRNLRNGGWKINSREHFYAIAALAMRQVLIDLARTRTAQRRGYGKIPESLNGHPSADRADGSDPEALVQIGMLMERLEKRDPLTARIIDMHYFAGFTLEEIADITGQTFRQVRHRWEKGRDWLKDGLQTKNFAKRNGDSGA